MTTLTLVQDLPASSLTRPYSQWFDIVPALGINFVDHLFNRLDGAYPHKWRSNFANQQAIDNWAESWVEAFEEEHITPADVKIGLRECRNRFTWPPSCAEFILACRPSADPLIAYHEALAGLEARGKGEMGAWSHPAIYWAASLLRADLMGQTYAVVKDRWAALLKSQMERGEWAPIPAARVLLPMPDVSPATKAHATKILADLGATGVIKGRGDDPKAWAKRIHERLARGDKTLSSLQISFAKTAMGAHLTGATA
ncbi:hypothetical protein BN2497_10487 [Janthinobacterium sp. CG23_2]|nr:hypothetical protein BN2497_10487 [Janthinobacterium sp. CG23_2]CUU31641.1 hypothetical protein BN3177_10487 [Janthinobacterium sp. CG23_2]